MFKDKLPLERWMNLIALPTPSAVRLLREGHAQVTTGRFTLARNRADNSPLVAASTRPCAGTRSTSCENGAR